MARDRLSENELLSDLRAFDTVNIARNIPFRVGESVNGKSSNDGINQGNRYKAN